MDLIYSAGGRVNRVRLIIVLSWLFMIFFLYCAVHFFFNVSSAAAGGPRPFINRISFSFMVAAIGGLLVWAMYLYGRLYVTHIRITPDGQRIEVGTLKFLSISTEEFPSSDVLKGDSPWTRWMPKISVDAPYLLLRIRDRSLPFFIDMQQDVVESKRLLELLGAQKGKRPDENVIV